MGMKHRLIFYTGPMFSGKSARLLQNIEELEDLTSTRALVYKPLLDSRNNFEVRSRAGRSRPAYSLDEPSMLRSLLGVQQELGAGKKLILGFDEVQFFDWNVIEEIIQIHRQHPRVIILAAGLNLDYLGRSWPFVQKLTANATNVVVCAARCSACAGEATMTYRKPGVSSKTMVVGDSDIYQPRCPACWSDGQNESLEAA